MVIMDRKLSYLQWVQFFYHGISALLALTSVSATTGVVSKSARVMDFIYSVFALPFGLVCTLLSATIINQILIA